MNTLDKNQPLTTIFVGSGCSSLLGAPTKTRFIEDIIARLNEFMSIEGKADDKLLIDTNDSYWCHYASEMLVLLESFLNEMKGAKLSLNHDLLDLEGLYRIAKRNASLYGNEEHSEDPLKLYPAKRGKSQRNDLARRLVSLLNQCIYLALRNVGDEFLNNPNIKAKAEDDELLEIRRQSLVGVSSDAEIDRRTALIAYLCMVSFRERNNMAPLFVQLNWDLALDRAIYRHRQQNLSAKTKPNSDTFPWLTRRKLQETPGRLDHDFTKSPLVLKLRGSINWHKSLPPALASFEAKEGEPKRELQLGQLLGEFEGTSGFENRLQIKFVSETGQEVNSALGDEDDKAYQNSQKTLQEFLESQSNTPIKSKLTAAATSPLGEFFGTNLMISMDVGDDSMPQIREQARLLVELSKNTHRILLIGIDQALSDLGFCLVLADCLRESAFAPRIYIWNPEIFIEGPVRESYLSLFAPLAREGRLYGIKGKFGDPALYDLGDVFDNAVLVST